MRRPFQQNQTDPPRKQRLYFISFIFLKITTITSIKIRDFYFFSCCCVLTTAKRPVNLVLPFLPGLTHHLADTVAARAWAKVRQFLWSMLVPNRTSQRYINQRFSGSNNRCKPSPSYPTPPYLHHPSTTATFISNCVLSAREQSHRCPSCAGRAKY